MNASSSKTGKIIALLFFASWVAGVGAYMVLKPSFKHGKELLKAVEAGQTAEVSRLLQEGASVQVRDRDGHTALWIAAYYNYAEIAEALLKHGADPNARGIDGWTPLMRAANHGNVEVVSVLLRHGANVNAKGYNGETALNLATGDRQRAAATLLREAGAE